MYVPLLALEGAALPSAVLHAVRTHNALIVLSQEYLYRLFMLHCYLEYQWSIDSMV
jgi:hypothetical protein